jgi:hypothetical protein
MARMATAELEAHVRDEGETAVIELTGDIDRDAEAALDAAYSQVDGTRLADFMTILDGEGS